MTQPQLKIQKRTQKGPKTTSLTKDGMTYILPNPDQEKNWVYRVELSQKQAIISFYKYGMLGIGFESEEDWNTNLPATVNTDVLFKHISHNKGDDSIPDELCIQAIRLIQDQNLSRLISYSTDKEKFHDRT